MSAAQRLRASLQGRTSNMPTMEYISPSDLREVLDLLDAAEKDAGRYRFVRDPKTYERYPELGDRDYETSEELDAEVDKRIAISARASTAGDAL